MVRGVVTFIVTIWPFFRFGTLPSGVIEEDSGSTRGSVPKAPPHPRLNRKEIVGFDSANKCTELTRNTANNMGPEIIVNKVLN
jgi:hypothetical protein